MSSSQLRSHRRPPATLPRLLAGSAFRDPGRLLYTFVTPDGQEQPLTVGELWQQAQAVAAALDGRCAAGGRAMLFYAPGPEFLASFWGCLFARVIPVPVPLPSMNRELSSIHGIVRDARPSVGLTSAGQVEMLRAWSAAFPEFSDMRWVTVDASVRDNLEQRRKESRSSAIAYLQYTSGSTSTPKGVMVTHDNVLANLAYIDRDFRHDASSIGVTWLPHYHDMGLVYGLLQPLYCGFSTYVMTPMMFIQEPIRWLRTISRVHATHSGGPNFAYDLCARRIRADECDGLDLRSWRVAFNGAEPVLADTMNAFAARFQPFGFARQAFYPAYGLAEATLKVSGGSLGEETVLPVDRRRLQEGRVVDTSETDAAARLIVSSGSTHDDTIVEIVNPETGTPSAGDETGEIWVSGPAVAAGYWRKRKETSRVFGARLERNPDRRFLRTGDLGFVRDGKVFVTGRLKDIIIVYGRNHYPEDIELTASRSHSALHAATTAAFTVGDESDQRLAIVQEIHHVDASVWDEIIRAIRHSVLALHGLRVPIVVLTKPRTIPRTTSGKIQRQSCKAAFLAGSLAALRLDEQASSSDIDDGSHYLDRVLGDILNVDWRVLRRDIPLIELGLDSLGAVSLARRLKEDLDISLPVARLIGDFTATSLAVAIDSHVSQAASGSKTEPEAESTGGLASLSGDAPLSVEQERLWWLDTIADSAAHHIGVGLRLRGPLDVECLERALEEMVRRHGALRTAFANVDGRLVQRLCPVRSWRLHIGDLRDLPDEIREAEARRLGREEVRLPFELDGGLLLRSALFRLRADEHIVVFTVHHIVADMWSARVLVQETFSLYATRRAGSGIQLPALAAQYSDFARWQRRYIESAGFRAELTHWQQELGSIDPTLPLPYDQPRPAALALSAATIDVRLDPALGAAIRAVSRGERTTVFAVLMAGMHVLLRLLTSRESVVAGAPFANRARAEWAGLIGFFAHPVLIGSHVQGNPTLREILGAVQAALVRALDHQDAPFAEVVPAVWPKREHLRSPVPQVMVSLTNPVIPDAPIGALHIEPFDVPVPATDVDLFFQFVEDPNGLSMRVHYASELFARATADALCHDYLGVLRQLVDTPSRALSECRLESSLAVVRRDEPAAVDAVDAEPIVIASTFTADPIGEILSFWSREFDFPLQVRFEPVAQVFQQLTDPASLMRGNARGTNVVLLRLEDWAGRVTDGPAERIAAAERNADDFVRLLRAAADRVSATWIVVICPLPPAVEHGPDLAEPLERLARRLASDLRGFVAVETITSTDLIQAYPVDAIHDPRADRLANLPYTSAFFAGMATTIFRRILRGRTPAFKAIAIDCDNTLWSGICGEAGASGIEITKAREDLQRFLATRSDRGMLLCLCSRNNEEDVAEVFASRQMPLDWEQFVARRINWRPKSENLRALAEELGIGLDSLILLDDDPAECAEVLASCPEVLTSQLPATDDGIRDWLGHHWAFDLPNDSAESLRRSSLYRDRAERTRDQARFADLQSFIDSLDLRVDCAIPDTQDAARISELTYRTNQFNNTGIRRSMADVLSAMSSTQIESRVVRVGDRFGDYGLVGVLMFTAGTTELVIDSFLLSCRVLGRGVEHRMLSEMGRLAFARDLTAIVIRFRESQKNRPIRQFLDSLASTHVSEHDGERRYRISAVDARDARPRFDAAGEAPPPIAVDTLAAERGRTSPESIDRGATLARVATDLNSAEKILAAATRTTTPDTADQAYGAPRTPTERRIARIWSEVLGSSRVGIHDDFFDLGGHSLRAVQALARVSEELGVDVPLQFFFEGTPTVADMARIADEEQLRQADPEKLAALIEEVGALSEGQIREQLAAYEPSESD